MKRLSILLLGSILSLSLAVFAQPSDQNCQQLTLEKQDHAGHVVKLEIRIKAFLLASGEPLLVDAAERENFLASQESAMMIKIQVYQWAHGQGLLLNPEVQQVLEDLDHWVKRTILIEGIENRCAN